MDFTEIFNNQSLTLEQFNSAIEERKLKLADLSGGAYVSKDKLDAKIKELEAVQQSLNEKDNALKKWDGVDLDKLKADYSAETEKLNKRIKELQKQNAIDTSLLSDDIQDLPAIKAYIDFDTIKVNEDGSVSGLKEQVEKLKAEKSFLFKVATTAETPSKDVKKLSTGVEHTNDTQPVAGLKGALAERLGLS